MFHTQRSWPVTLTADPPAVISRPGISDHSLIFAIRKICVVAKQENTLQIRNMKNFDQGKFIEELLKQHWEYVYFFPDDPKAMMWEIWKNLFLGVLDKHAPLQKSLGLQVI
jgi:hypothetical protein